MTKKTKADLGAIFYLGRLVTPADMTDLIDSSVIDSLTSDTVNNRIGVNTPTPLADLDVSGVPVAPLPAFASRGTLVPAAPYATVTNGAANYGPSTGQTSLDFVNIGHLYRIRQNGVISRVKLCIAATTAITHAHLKIWRYNGATYDLVGISDDLVGSLVAGQVNTLTLSSAITAQIGDYVGFRLEYSSASAQILYTTTAINTLLGESGNTLYSVLDATPSATVYDWAAQTAVVNQVVLIECDMPAPVFAVIGDSITSMGGSFIENTQNGMVLTKPYCYRLGQLLSATYQDMGIGGTTTTQMAARFAADVVALHPAFMVLMGGINNIRNGDLNTTIMADITAMLNAAIADGIVPVVIGVTPFRNWGGSLPATNAMLQQRDLLNAAIHALVIGAPYHGYFVDPSPYLGEFYGGGDAGNLWAMQAVYDSNDGLHPNAAGELQLAQAVFDALTASPARLQSRLGDVHLTGNTTLAGDQPRSLQIDRNTISGPGGANLTIGAGGAAAGATDAQGGNLVLEAGTATGAGASDIILRAAGGKASGAEDTPPTERVVIKGVTGSVGIGEVSPLYPLEVRKDVVGQSLALMLANAATEALGNSVAIDMVVNHARGITARIEAILENGVNQTGIRFLAYGGTSALLERGRFNKYGLVLPYTGHGSGQQVGSMELDGYQFNKSFITDNLYFDGSDGFHYRANGYASLIALYQGSTIIYSMPLGVAGAIATPTRRVNVTQLGAVEIDGGVTIYNAETLSGNLITTWMNSGYVEEIFTLGTPPTDLTQVANTTDVGYCYAGPYTVVSGHRYRATFTLTLNSGALPTFMSGGTANALTPGQLTANTVVGSNTIEWVSLRSGADEYVGFMLDHLLGDFAITGFSLKEVTLTGGTLTVGNINLANLAEHADNAAALGAGLVAGDLYRIGDGVGVVH